MTKGHKNDAHRRKRTKPQQHSPIRSTRRMKMADSSSNVIRCRKCGQTNEQGHKHCHQCNASLRPIFLFIIALLGTFFLLISTIGVILQVKECPTFIVILNILFHFCGIAIFLGLLFGNRLAWIAVHFSWAIDIVFSFILFLLTTRILGAVIFACTLIFGLFFLLYLHTRRVRILCSVQQRDRTMAAFAFITIILTLIPFSLGKYFEFNSPDAFDGGAYVYSAKHILDGAEIGVEEKPSAKLGTLTVNMLGVRLFGFRDIGPEIVQTLFQLAALALMFVAMKKLFGTIAAGVGVIVASVYLSAPLIAKYGNVKEQFMIAFMIMGISCFVMRQLGGRWWWALLAGGFVSWAPLFKETGTSAIGAMGLFVILQPILKHRTWKQTGIDILLLLAGAIAAISPFYIWILGWNVKMALPYQFVWQIFIPAKAGSGSLGGSYISGARRLRPFSRQWPIVLRFYSLLILPIALALGSIVMRIIRMIFAFKLKEKVSANNYDRFVLLFAFWWLLDMAFIWISPRSYEQYYLPLNASAAMLGGYFIALYIRKLSKMPAVPVTGMTMLMDVVYLSGWMIVAWLPVRMLLRRLFGPEIYQNYSQYCMVFYAAVIMLVHGLVGVLRDRLTKQTNWFRWIYVGLISFVCMVAMSWHVFFGIKRSPHSGVIYTNTTTGIPDKRNGYSQRYHEISSRRQQNGRYPWELVGEYIRDNSDPSDKIFVWGWYPGIYVAAQRLAPTSWPFTSEMHTKTPERFANDINALLVELEADKPKYIVDSRKRHFPGNRPPLELWPVTGNGLLPNDEKIINQFDIEYAKMLRERIDDAEAGRFEAMKPFREFIRKNYDVVQPFGSHILFKLKNLATG